MKKDEIAPNQLSKTEEKKQSTEKESVSEKKGNDAEEKELECNICMHNILHGQMARELPCGHIFHKKCIDRWFKDECYCPLDKLNIRELLKKPQESK